MKNLFKKLITCMLIAAIAITGVSLESVTTANAATKYEQLEKGCTITIYDMYKGWSKKNNPDGGLVGIKLFLKELESYDLSKYGWTYEDKYKRVGDRMFREEPLLDEYNCVDWMKNPNSNYNIRDRITIENPPVTAKGLFKDNWQPKNTAGGYAFIDE